MGEKGSEPDLNGADLHIAVIVSRYNEDVSKRLLRGALGALSQGLVGVANGAYSLDALTRPNPDDPTGKSVMRRVPEVLDCWFDSGSMPFAQYHAPFENQEHFEARFPADFICEALDQTRGWFYSLLAISTLLFKQNAYRNVICLGLVVDPKGKKASKSRGNVLDPNFLFDNFGSDAVRWYFYTSTQVGENYRTGADTLRETVQQFFIPLWNCYSFFVTYARLDGFDPAQQAVAVSERNVLDRWLLSKLSGLVAAVSSGLDGYDANEPARKIQRFADDLSNWYIRRSRRRFWKSQSDSDKLAAYQTLYEALRTVCQLMAPFAPFTSDAMYRNLSKDESVHLSDFPEASPYEDAQVEADMARARQAVEAGLSARDAARRLPQGGCRGVAPRAGRGAGTYAAGGRAGD